MNRFARALVSGGIVAMLAVAAAFGTAGAQESRRQELRSFGPARLRRARDAREQGRRSRGQIDRQAGRGPARHRRRAGQELLVFAYELIRGTASNGQMSGDNLYPAPTLQVFPGETLIVHLDNAMTGLTIRDFFDPAIYGQGQGGAALPVADDLFARQPSRSRRACQSQGKRRQRDAAHPGREVEHLTPTTFPRPCRRAPIGIISHLHTLTAAACLLRLGRACWRSAAPTGICRW